MQPLEFVPQLDWWRVAPALGLGWLACFFGRTLRSGRIPLIERVARIGIPDLSPQLCRYTRHLTSFWTAFFVVAALLSLVVPLSFWFTGLLVASGALLLFVGEYLLRPVLFPETDFPSLRQQVRDTVVSWRLGS